MAGTASATAPPNANSAPTGPTSGGTPAGNTAAPASGSAGAGANANQNPNTSSSSAAAAANNTPGAENTNRGLPYYEKLRRELRDTLQKKRLMDKSMAQLEDQIFRFEQSYLEETTAGNIIKGFDNYIKGSSTGSVAAAAGISFSGGGGGSIGTGGGGAAGRRKAQVMEADRVFSRSSAGYLRDSPTPPSTQSTPSHAATPTGMNDASANSKAGSSKNKKKASGGNKGFADDDIEDGDKQPMKRLKISYGRDY